MKERPDTVEYASLSRRLMGAAIDLFILFVITNIIAFPLAAIVYAGYTPEMLMNELQAIATPENTISLSALLDLMSAHGMFLKFFIVQGTIFSMMAVYVIFFWTRYGSTPGKWVVGCKVVNYNYDKISIAQSIVRIFGYILSCFTFFLGFIMAEFTKNKQGLHDKVARTYVICFKHDLRRFSSFMKKVDEKIQ